MQIESDILGRALGAHMSIADGVDKAVERADRIGATALQIFTRNQVRWEAPPRSKDEIRRFQRRLAASRIRFVCAHASYLINLASSDDEIRQRSCRALVDELSRAQDLNCFCLVLHPGSPKLDGAAVGLERVVAGLREVLEKTEALKVRIALENTAGQGNVLGGYVAQLMEIIHRLDNHPRLGLCLDTCHGFAAGIDFRVVRAVESLAEEIRCGVGLERLYVLHLNDCKTECGSGIDRHQHIGQGHLGNEGFRNLLSEPLFKGIPGIIETPKKDSDWASLDVANLTRLRELENV